MAPPSLGDQPQGRGIGASLCLSILCFLTRNMDTEEQKVIASPEYSSFSPCPAFLTTAPRGCGSPDNSVLSVIIMQLPSHSCVFTRVEAGHMPGLWSRTRFCFLLHNLGQDAQTSQNIRFSWANSSRQNSYSAKLFWIHINVCKSSG